MRKSLCLLASVAIALLSGCHGLVVVKASTSGSPAGAGARASGASSFENCPNCSLVLKSDGGSVVAKAVSKNDVAVSWVESSSAAAEFKRIH
ncbi:MAG TPA: hypothetical protein VGS41_04590, partial [Chthonomonadales bacterium]|nr:hypothetical protein [Chthonomonadales bacterium]